MLLRQPRKSKTHYTTRINNKNLFSTIVLNSSISFLIDYHIYEKLLVKLQPYFFNITMLATNNMRLL